MQIQKNNGFGNKKLLVAMATAMLCLTGYFNKDSQVVKAYDVNGENVETDLNNSGDILGGYFVVLLIGAIGGSFVTHKIHVFTKNKLYSEIDMLEKLNKSRTIVVVDPRFQGHYPLNDGCYYENNRSMRGTNNGYYHGNNGSMRETEYSRRR